MALTKDQKKDQVTALRDRLKKAKSLMFVHYRGLSVDDIGTFRGNLLEKGAEMKVGKKTLFRIAAKEENYPEVEDSVLDGPVGFVFSFEDEMSGAKVAFEFGKKNEAIEIIGGVLNGKVLTKDEAIEFAKILSKEELLAKFAAMIRSPLSSFASLCGSPMRGFAMGVNQLAEKGGFQEAEDQKEASSFAPAGSTEDKKEVQEDEKNKEGKEGEKDSGSDGSKTVDSPEEAKEDAPSDASDASESSEASPSEEPTTT